MYGRYGFGYGAADRLNIFLVVLYPVSVLIATVLRLFGLWYLYLAFMLIGYLSVSLVLIRMLSKNISKRTAENMKYLKIRNGIKSEFKFFKMRVREGKTNRFRRCPSCKAQIRLPIKKGKHTVVCPSCKKRFDVRILF